MLPMLRCDVFPDPVSRRGIEVSFPSKGGEMMTRPHILLLLPWAQDLMAPAEEATALALPQAPARPVALHSQ